MTTIPLTIGWNEVFIWFGTFLAISAVCLTPVLKINLGATLKQTQTGKDWVPQVTLDYLTCLVNILCWALVLTILYIVLTILITAFLPETLLIPKSRFWQETLVHRYGFLLGVKSILASIFFAKLFVNIVLGPTAPKHQIH